MDNITIEKVWSDSNLLELKVYAESEFVKIHQSCYIEKADLIEIGHKIVVYTCENNDEKLYVEFGKKEGNFTPAFSMEFSRKDTSGHINIEMDMEIDDISDRSHRCKFFVEGELGSIENFGKSLEKISSYEDEKKYALYTNY